MARAICAKCGRTLREVSGPQLKFLVCPECGTAVLVKSQRPAGRAPAENGGPAPTLPTSTPEAPPVAADAAPPARRQGRTVVFAAFGAGVFVALALAGLIALLRPADRSREAEPVTAVQPLVPLTMPPPWRPPAEPEPEPSLVPVEVTQTAGATPPPAPPPRPPARPDLPELDRPAATAPPTRPDPPKADPAKGEPPASRPAGPKAGRQEDEEESRPPKAARPAAEAAESPRPVAKSEGDDAPRPKPAAEAPPAEPATAVARVKRATVLLRVKLPDGSDVSGSGFFAHEPGLVVTNAHVLGMLDPSARRPRSVQVVVNSGEKDSRTLAGKVLGVDRGSDLGVVRVDGDGLPPPLRVVRADDLVETQDLYIFGFPFGEQLGSNITVSKTSVSSLRKSGGYLQQIQVNGGMHPGNSGGPLTDTAGRVVGVAVSAIRGTQIQFAIPGERVHYFLNGRAVAQGIDPPYRDGDRVKAGVNVELIDPLGRVRKVGVEVWTADAGPPRLAADAEPPAQPGDSPKQTFAMAYDKATATAKGEIELPKVEGKKLYWLRPVFVNGAGESRWLGVVGKPLPAPVERTPADLRSRPEMGTHSAALLVSNADFKLHTPEGRQLSIGMNLKAGLDERVEEADPGRSARLRLTFTGFGLTVLEDGKPLLGKDDARHYSGETRNLGAELELDGEGGIVRSHPDFSRVPRAARAAMEDISEQVLQSLEVLSVPLPGETVQPLHTWKAQRHVRVGALGFAVPSMVDVKYTYLGTELKDGQTTALVSLGGTVRGVRGDGLNVGGRVSGAARVDPETGAVLAAETTVKADLDVEFRGQHYKALGTLSVQINRSGLGQAPAKKK